MRLNRYLAHRGYATRRAADGLIKAGRVLLNGRKAKLGEKIQSTDTVEVIGGVSERELLYIAYYKPRGVITHSPQAGERSIGQIASFGEVFPVGRLDKESEGLIILTNDGRITERLLHPRFRHEKEYQTTVREKIPHAAPAILEKGVVSAGERLTAQKVTILGPHTLSVVLTEGKKHQIRRMLDAVNLTVEKLVRIRIMGIHLGALTPGSGRKITGAARLAFLRSLDLSNPAA